MTMFDTPELSMLHDMASRFAADHAETTDGQSLWPTFAEMGWLGLGLSEDEGGLGPRAVATVMEAMGRHAIASPYIAGSVIAASVLSRCERADELEAVTEGKLRLGVDASLLLPATDTRLSVTVTAEGVRVSGEVVAVGWSMPDKVLGAAVDAAGETRLLLLPLASAENCRSIALVDGGQGARLCLSDTVFSPASIIAEGPACRSVIEAVQMEGLLAAAADNLGAMQALFDQTLSYAKLRRQFGRAIGSFQSLQFRLTDMWIKLDEARSLVITAAEALAAQEPEAKHQVAAAWMQALWSGRLIAEEAVQLHGAIGMTEECAVGRFVKRMLVNELLFGADELHLARYRRRTARQAEPSAAA